MSATKRIVCYAINGSGLGHLTRLVAIARWLRRYVALLDNRPPEVIFLTSSDAGDTLSQAGFAAFKIPSKTVATSADLDKLEYRRLAKHFVWNTLGVFSPDLLVVDTFPSGSFDELFQVLDGPFKKGFVYRNVKPEYASRPTFKSAINLYDAIVVPHQDDATDSLTDRRVAHCGEVIQFERAELLDAMVARHELGVAPHRRLIYVSAGGGGDPDAESQLTSLVRALEADDDLHVLVGAGPLYRGRRISGSRVTWFEGPRVWPYFSAVDAAICAAGYNTFHELLYAQVPSAFFAQSKVADDQRQRVSRAEVTGACMFLPEVVDADEIRRKARALLDSDVTGPMRSRCRDFLPTNGARSCALELIRPLYDEAQLAQAFQVLSPRVVASLQQVGNGSASVIPEWLTPLLAHTPASLTAYSGLDRVIHQLTPSAAREVKAVLGIDGQDSERWAFEGRFTELLDTVVSCANSGSMQLVPEEVLKTLLAAMKKQPIWASGNDSRDRWGCSLMEGVQSLIEGSYAGVSVSEVLLLYRMFPRIADVDAHESFELFSQYLERHLARGEQTSEIMRNLQLLKMANPKISRATIEGQMEPTPL